MNQLRYIGTRDEQIKSLRASGYTVVSFKRAPVTVAFRNYGIGANPVTVKAWRGNAQRASFYYGFKSLENAQRYVEDYVNSVAKAQGVKADWRRERAEKRAALRAADHYTVGDVLYDSWGYDQTNIDFYQVTHVGAKSIKIRAIKVNYAETGWLQGQNQPRRNEFVANEPELTKPLAVDGGITSKHGCFSKWTGKAVWSSSYH